MSRPPAGDPHAGLPRLACARLLASCRRTPLNAPLVWLPQGHPRGEAHPQLLHGRVWRSPAEGRQGAAARGAGVPGCGGRRRHLVTGLSMCQQRAVVCGAGRQEAGSGATAGGDGATERGRSDITAGQQEARVACTSQPGGPFSPTPNIQQPWQWRSRVPHRQRAQRGRHAGRASNSRWPGGGDGSAGGGGATSLAAVRRSMQPAKQLGSTLLGALAAQMRGAWDFCWQRWEAAPGCSGRRAAPCRGKGSAHEPCPKRPCHKAFRCCCPCRVHRCWSSSPGSSPCSARRATLSASGPSAAMRRSPATSPCAGRRRCSCWCVGLDVVAAGWLRFRGCVFCSAM